MRELTVTDGQRLERRLWARQHMKKAIIAKWVEAKVEVFHGEACGERCPRDQPVRADLEVA